MHSVRERTMPEVEMVEGLDISPEEVNCPGWRTSLSKKRKSRPVFPSSADTTFKYKQLALQGDWLQPRGSHTYQGAKDGMDVKKMSLYAVMRALTTALGITEEACKQDLLCPNPMQNVYVLTTPAVKNSEAYAKANQIIFGTKQHAIAAYVAAPENTCRGVVRNIYAHLTDI
ncbi:hypothetical protein HPB48_017300 [Haemaphysalis longicornis]|uniref:Uncharacterized protein n=1 Tax=Haemaphysalis longicornis TaxID=44386 RepID=A0A9J6H4F5_HAELO|nr:hypothetical protein HPB48_017300 [Haemaphysalis longicornis]